jgi:3-phenylpropionate/cinnamic acid dioxygenase small subunit
MDALERCTAHHAIGDLIYAYADSIDRGDLKELEALFADAVVTYRTPSGEERNPATGADFAARLSRSNVWYGDGTFRTKHVVTNVRIKLSDDLSTADATSYVTVFQATPTFPLQAVFSGRYLDSFKATNGAWAFSKRVMLGDLIGDLSHHVVSGRVPQ